MKGDEFAILELERARKRIAVVHARIAAMKSMGLQEFTGNELTGSWQQTSDTEKSPNLPRLRKKER